MNVAGSRRLVGLFLCASRRAGADGLLRPPRSGSAAGGPATGGATGAPAGAHAAPEIKPYDKVITKDAKSDEGSSPSIASRRRSITRFRRATGQRVSLGQPDRPDHARRRLWRTGGRQSRREMGTPQQSRAAAQRCPMKSWPIRARRSRARCRRRTTTRS